MKRRICFGVLIAVSIVVGSHALITGTKESGELAISQERFAQGFSPNLSANTLKLFVCYFLILS